MTARIFALVVIGWLWLGAVLPAGAASLTHTPPQWQAIGRGLTFTQVQVLQDGEVVTDLAVVKIDPASNAFRVFHGAAPGHYRLAGAASGPHRVQRQLL